MRDIWEMACTDFDNAGCIVRAQKQAFTEKSTEAEWYSDAQLLDQLKDPEHVANYQEFCRQNQLVKHCPKIKAKV